MERTFGFIKPEGLADPKILEEILEMIEASGLKIERKIQTTATRLWAERHYSEHEGKHFYDDLVNDIAEKEVMLLLLSGDDAINHWRALMGDFEEEKRSLPQNAGTIRTKFMLAGTPLRRNFCHGAKTADEVLQEYSLANQMLLLNYPVTEDI